MHTSQHIIAVATSLQCLEMHADAYLNGSLQITDTLKELTSMQFNSTGQILHLIVINTTF